MSTNLIPAILGAASEGGLLTQIYGDLAKPGVTQAGNALSTLIGLGNTILWPIQLLNERAKLILENNLDRFRQRIESIPSDNISPVVPEVGVPILEKLSYVTDASLRDLYVELLGKASQYATSGQAHPSFVNIINNLSPDEANLLRFLKKTTVFPYVRAKFSNLMTQHFQTISEVEIVVDEDISIAHPWNMPAYISNLQGLGILEISDSYYASPLTLYIPLEEAVRERFRNFTPPEGHGPLQLDRGRILVTRFGRLFLNACVASEP